MDLKDVLIGTANIIGTKLIEDNLGSFNFRNLLKTEENNLRHQEDYVTLEKLQLISPYAFFCALPDFNIEKPTMNKYLTDPFYDAAKKIVSDLNYSESDFDYCKKNYLATNVRTKIELLDFLIEQKYNTNRNDFRYCLGFRSFYFILRQNLNKIDYKYIAEINKIITPFYLTYKHKELFTPGIEYIVNK